jgi:hypothetical protein
LPANGKKRASGPSAGQAKLTHEQVTGVVGRIDDVRAAEIIATGATIEELEEAVAWAASESDVMGDLRLHASPVVAKVYDLLTVEEKLDDQGG